MSSVNFILLPISPRGKELFTLRNSWLPSVMLCCLEEKCSESTKGLLWINFFQGELFFFFSSHRDTYNTPFKVEDSGRELMFFLAAETKKRCESLSLPLTLSHPFCLPQLIHIVTPFNRGQAVKDPITEVKHTFHVPSVDSKVRTTNFMWKCIEIGGEFMRGVE